MALTKAQLIDLNANELIIDLDADTSITADTDDQIDIKIAGADDFRFTANTFTALAGSSIVVPASGLTIGSTAVTSTAAELNLIDGGASTGTTAVADADGIITNDGGTMRLTTAATFKTYFQEGISTAYDDLTAGDAAVNITTSSGNITIDAAANDSDIIFKGTDNSADITMLTLDGSAAGDATFNNQIIVGDGKLVLNSTAVTSTAAELNLLDGVSGLVQADLTKLAAIDATATELNLIDGDATVGTTAIADGDGLIINDAGTMRVSTVQTLAAYLDDEITAMPNLTTASALVTVSALDSGSITSGFGAIDNGTSNIRSATITAETAFVPDAANGASLGTSSLEFADLYLHDGAQILFGADQDVVLTHAADAGLTLKTATTSDDTKATLTLQTGDTDIAANDVLGQLHFQAPDEGAGTDAILVAAGIAAISEGDFSASNNATKLSFQTGASEAASEKMSLSSTGILTVADDIIIGDGKTIGSASDPDAISIASGGAVTFTQTPVFPDGSLALADLDIDGGTDIGAAIVDADLFIVDDGAGGTNRKTTASRIKTYVGGNPITLADQWHITANIDAGNSNTDTVITNWTQDGYTGYGKIGSMSESSGVFTFPSTGMYLVELALTFYYGVAASNYSYSRLQVTTDGSSFSTIAETTAFTRVAENYITTSPTSAIIDVTNTSNVLVRPVFHVRSSGTDVEGGSIVRSRFRFIRLGDT